LFVTEAIVLARFPQTWICWLDDDAKDKGNPLPVMVAYTPAPGLVYNGAETCHRDRECLVTYSRIIGKT
jgi:hypothetical protein